MIFLSLELLAFLLASETLGAGSICGASSLVYVVQVMRLLRDQILQLFVVSFFVQPCYRIYFIHSFLKSGMWDTSVQTISDHISFTS